MANATPRPRNSHAPPPGNQLPKSATPTAIRIKPPTTPRGRGAAVGPGAIAHVGGEVGGRAAGGGTTVDVAEGSAVGGTYPDGGDEGGVGGRGTTRGASGGEAIDISPPRAQHQLNVWWRGCRMSSPTPVRIK